MDVTFTSPTPITASLANSDRRLVFDLGAALGIGESVDVTFNYSETLFARGNFPAVGATGSLGTNFGNQGLDLDGYQASLSVSSGGAIIPATTLLSTSPDDWDFRSEATVSANGDFVDYSPITSANGVAGGPTTNWLGLSNSAINNDNSVDQVRWVITGTNTEAGGNPTGTQFLFTTDGATLVPEPSSSILVSLSCIGLIFFRKRSRKSHN